MARVAILRCSKLPGFVNWDIPNLDELFEEDNLLKKGFESQNINASSVIWSDPNIDWNEFDLALIRSTWDYIDAPKHFINVLSKIESASCKLFNPLNAIQWNMDKHYLLDLKKLGIPIVPTYPIFISNTKTIYNLFLKRQQEMIILKPTIGLGGSYSYKIPLGELKDRIIKLSKEKPHLEFLIQPYIENIVTEGELSFIYFNKKFSHVLQKKPAPNDYRVQEIYGGTIETINPYQQDLLQADDVMSKLPFDVLYARLDFVRINGRLSIMEIELIEPVFSFKLVPESVLRLVNAVKTKMKFD